MEEKGVIEVENFLLEKELSFIDSEILSHIIPWHYSKHSTSEKFPFFEHVIIPREQYESDITTITSPLHDFFTDIQKRFCEVCDIKMDKIYRQCLNLTFPCDESEHGDPHVDHTFPHKNIIFYLNDGYEMGETLFFDEDDNIVREVTPKRGKVVCFDGSISHSVRWISRGRRIIFVSTFY
jgi:hypothetical protein